MKKVIPVKKIIIITLIICVTYLIGGAFIPYMFRKTISEENKIKMDNIVVTNNEVGSDRVGLIESPMDAFNVRIAMIRAAQKSLDISYFIIHDDDSSHAILKEVLDAAKRNVKIRIIIDGKMTFQKEGTLDILAVLKQYQNVEVKEYRPISLVRPWTLQACMHDKFIIVDQTFLLLGGRNMGDQYFNPSNYEGAITNDRDVLVWNSENSGSSVLKEIESYMNLLWNHKEVIDLSRKIKKADTIIRNLIDKSHEFENQNVEYYKMTLNDYLDLTHETNKVTLIHNPINTTKKEPLIAYKIKQLLNGAKESIIIQTPYATANKDLINTLNGFSVPVTFLTNSLKSSPNYFAYSNYYSNRSKFLNTEIDIFELQSEHSIHAKSFVVDNHLSIVGSFNLDDRSYFIDTETMLIIDSVEFTQTLKSAMQDIKENSKLVSDDYSEEQNFIASKAGKKKNLIMRIMSFFTRTFEFLV